MVQRGFGGNALCRADRLHRMWVATDREPSEPTAEAAVPSHENCFRDPLQLAGRANPIGVQTALHRRAYPGDQAYRLRGQELAGLRLADDGETARLVEIGRDLGE